MARIVKPAKNKHQQSRDSGSQALQQFLLEAMLEAPATFFDPYTDMFRASAAQDAPRNVAELQQYFNNVQGIHIPDSPCFAHTQSPMEMVAALYFGSYPHIVAQGARDSGKTFLVGRTIAALLATVPGYSVVHAAANRQQSKVLSEELTRLCLSDEAFRTLVSEKHVQAESLLFDNGAGLRIVTGTASGFSSQHPGLLSFDEVDFFRIADIEHSFAVPTARMGRPSVWSAVSTRQYSNGAMNYLREHKKSFHFIEWTGFESMRPCKTCVALDQHPYGSDEARTDACALWKDCKGKAAFLARGWKSRLQLIELKNGMTEETWDAQVMGKTPSEDALVYGNVTHKLHPHGNHSTWKYQPSRPLYVAHDPAEGQTAVFLAAQIDDEGRCHIFAELIVVNCTDASDGKECYFDWAAETGLRDPQALIIDPSRTDAVSVFQRGSVAGIGYEHSYDAVTPSKKTVDGGQQIRAGIRVVRSAFSPISGVRHLYYNPETCPALDFALRDYAWKLDSDKNVKADRLPQEQHKDIMDTLRYLTVYLSQEGLLGSELEEIVRGG